MGALRPDADKGGVDVLCAGGEKWMLNPHVGSGFTHISKELLEGLNPAPYGILNSEEPGSGWSGYWPDPGKDVWSPPVSKSVSKFEWGGEGHTSQ
ncbi:hypothetical protein [Thermogladius calderae]|uniref:hypothetical protein n=1 Tax=Thermogladius calderae TaxID=1200300 RepID=UPI00064E989C|nr:hypothetical protein [Thermogladius calderae]